MRSARAFHPSSAVSIGCLHNPLDFDIGRFLLRGRVRWFASESSPVNRLLLLHLVPPSASISFLSSASFPPLAWVRHSNCSDFCSFLLSLLFFPSFPSDSLLASSIPFLLKSVPYPSNRRDLSLELDAPPCFAWGVSFRSRPKPLCAARTATLLLQSLAQEFLTPLFLFGVQCPCVSLLCRCPLFHRSGVSPSILFDALLRRAPPFFVPGRPSGIFSCFAGWFEFAASSHLLPFSSRFPTFVQFPVSTLLHLPSLSILQSSHSLKTVQRLWTPASATFSLPPFDPLAV